MKCQACGYENREDARFCDQCAAELGLREDVERFITTTIDHDATNDDDLAFRQRILDRILDTIDDASNAPTQYVQMCLAA